MAVNFPHLRAAIMRHPWAIMDDYLETMMEVVERRISGVRFSQEEIDAIKHVYPQNGSLEFFGMNNFGEIEARSPSENRSGDQQGAVVAVISIAGVIAQHASQIDSISGPTGTSTERVAQSFRAAIADPAVKAIVLNTNSPGGNVYGVQALADEIYKARGKKPIVAQVNSLAASAAYWIATSADEIVMTPGSQAGSIGVYSVHRDVSKAAEMKGEKYTIISAGKFKVEGMPYEPLQDEAMQAMQKTANAYYSDFTRAVARGRGVSVNDVRSGFGEGRIEKDDDAVKLGMADRVATLDATLKRLASAKAPAGATAAIPMGKEEPRALTVRTENGAVVSHFLVEEAFPSATIVTQELILDARDGKTSGIMTELPNGGLKITLANAEATYALREVNRVTGCSIFDLVSASYAPTPPASTEASDTQAAQDRDAFRRRRFAMNQRRIRTA
jgi:signal peptide peptidase SppA